MILRIFGIFLIIAGCCDICAAIWHLIDKLKTPKNKRIWWGIDDAMQVFVFPTGIFFIATGIYLLAQ
jgi:hypothetical protein